MLSCSIWRGLVSLEIAAVRLFSETLSLSDRDKNMPLVFSHRGLFGIRECIMKFKQKDDKDAGPIKDRQVRNCSSYNLVHQLRDMISEATVFKRRFDLLSQFCEL